MGTLRAALTYLMTSRLRDWLVLVPVAAAALTLAMIGYTLRCEPGHCLTFFAALFRSIDLLRFGRLPDPAHSPPELFFVPFFIPGAMLVTGARLALRNLRREMRVVWAHRLRDHAIVCGLGDTGQHVVENLRAAGKPVVVITLAVEDEKAAACEELGIPVLKGDARQISLLNLAGLPYARALVATCGSDAVNIEIGLRARDALSEEKGQRGFFEVLPEMRSQWLLETIWLHRFAALGSENIEFRPFNLYSGAARDVLRRGGFGRRAREPEGARSRVILAGFGETNTQLILEAMQKTCALPGRRFCATVFDDKGAARLPALEARYPGVTRLADLDFVGCTFDTEDPSAWSAVDQALSGAEWDAAPLSVVIALADDATSLYAALQFRERLDRQGAVGTPVFVRLRDQSRLGGFAASLDGPNILVTRFAPFGDLAALTKPGALFDRRADALARALHASYLETTPDPGDYPAAVPWAQLPERFKQSNRLFADHLPIALGELGIALAQADAPPLALSESEIEALAAMEHWRWSVERQLLGWTAGKPRDDAARRHPLLLPWSELEEEDRERNRRLARAVPKVVAAAGAALLRERFIPLSGRERAEAVAEIAALSRNEEAILLLDPQDPAAWAAALGALEKRAVKIWILWRPGAPIPAFPRDLTGKDVLRPAIGGWIGERECAALIGGRDSGSAAAAREAAA